MGEPASKRTKIQAPESRSNGVKLSHQASQDTSEGSMVLTGVSQSSLASLCDSYYCVREGKNGVKLEGPKSERSVVKKGKLGQIPTTTASSSSGLKDAGPRVEIIDGKIVLKESSLIVGSNDNPLSEMDYEEVEEGAQVTSRYSSFTNKRAGKMWGVEETKIFYHVLRQCGLDFSMMQSFFPTRTRNELKKKFQREEKKHPKLMKLALGTSLPLELEPFELQLGEKVDYKKEPLVVVNEELPAEEPSVEEPPAVEEAKVEVEAGK